MAAESRSKDQHARRAKIFVAGAASAIVWAPLFGFQFLMLWMIILKEDEHFWTNAGGYSVGFRDFVDNSYYPLFFLDLGLVLAGTLVAILLFTKHPFSGMIAFCWLPMIWLMIAVILYINISDNVSEFLGKVLASI